MFVTATGVTIFWQQRGQGTLMLWPHWTNFAKRLRMIGLKFGASAVATLFLSRYRRNIGGAIKSSGSGSSEIPPLPSRPFPVHIAATGTRTLGLAALRSREAGPTWVFTSVFGPH